MTEHTGGSDMEESSAAPKEIHYGRDIDSIEIDGGMSRFREVRVLLKDGRHITMRAEIDISPNGITPHIRANRGKWGRIGNATMSTEK